MTLAAADRNDIRGTVSSEADFRSDIYSDAKFNLIDKIYSNMVTVKFSTHRAETLFLMPTIAIEQYNSETAIRFVFLRGVFNIEIDKYYGKK